MRSLLRMALPVALLVGGAGICALVSNALARPERRLSWVSVPPPAAPATVPAVSTVTPEPSVAPPPVVLHPTAARPAVRTPAPPAPEPVNPFPVQPGQPIREIDARQARVAFQAQVPFLDARRSEEYALGHVKGAWSLPIWESVLDARITEFEAVAAPPPEGPLVLYCSGGSCEDSHLLASKLFQLGYRNLLIYRDGYPDWVAQGGPVATGVAR